MIVMLQDRISSWNEQHKIADAFIHFVCYSFVLSSPFFQLPLPLLFYCFISFVQLPNLSSYSSYCANYNAALILVSQCIDKNEKFSQFLEEQIPYSQHPKIADYLILPVQRIPVCLILFLFAFFPHSHRRILLMFMVL